MKLISSALAVSLVLVMQTAHADLVSDSEKIMDAAQQQFSQFFPSSQTTQTLDPWRYRFYPQTGIYLGVNQGDSAVYLLGGAFGDSIYTVGSVDSVLTMLGVQEGGTQGEEAFCKLSSFPEGFIYKQTGNVIDVKTDGCIEVVIPDTKNFCDVVPNKDASGVAVATGIHVYVSSDISHFELEGLQPSFSSIVEGVLGDVANPSSCVINAPVEMSNFTSNLDVCLDITNQAGLSDFATPGQAVTLHTISTNMATVVDSCFSTGADAITDIVTKEVWGKNESGSFDKIN